MISRRGAIGAACSGAVLGLIGIARTRSNPSIRFIGRRESIIALLDTGTERAIFLLGEPDDDLLGHVPGLTTIGNTRIDLAVASHRSLAARSARDHLQLASTAAISIQADASLSPVRGNVTPVTAKVDLQLGPNTRLRLIPSITSGNHPDFVAEISIQDTSMVLCSAVSALRLVEDGGCELLAVPGQPSARSLVGVQPQLIVCNSPHPTEVAAKQMQIYSNDPQLVYIERAGIRIRDDQLSS